MGTHLFELPCTLFLPNTYWINVCCFLHVNSGSNKIHKVLMPFSVVDVRELQVFQVVQRVEDVTIEDYMIGRLFLNAGTICCFILCEKKHE